MSQKDSIEKGSELLKNCQIVSLASIDENGYPRPVPMSQLKSDGLKNIWLSTGNSSAKTNHFRNNPKAGVSFFVERDSVVLTGKIEVITDEDVKKELWQDWLINHFKGGVTDPEYVVLKFTAEDAALWIDFQFVKTAI